MIAVFIVIVIGLVAVGIAKSASNMQRALLICFDLLLLAGGFFALCEYLRRL